MMWLTFCIPEGAFDRTPTAQPANPSVAKADKHINHNLKLSFMTSVLLVRHWMNTSANMVVHGLQTKSLAHPRVYRVFCPDLRTSPIFLSFDKRLPAMRGCRVRQSLARIYDS